MKVPFTHHRQPLSISPQQPIASRTGIWMTSYPFQFEFSWFPTTAQPGSPLANLHKVLSASFAGGPFGNLPQHRWGTHQDDVLRIFEIH